MLNLGELKRAVSVLREARIGALVDRVVQDGPDRLVLALSRESERFVRDRTIVRLCVSQRAARLSELTSIPKAETRQSGFIQFLKAHYVSLAFVAVEVAEDDRFARFDFQGKGGQRSLLFQILGPRSNIYALDEKGLINASLRPTEKTRRDLEVGELWRVPEGSASREGEDRFAAVDDKALLVAIEEHYAKREREESEDRQIKQITQALRKQRASILRKLRRLEREQEAGSRAQEFRKMGELLKGVLGDVIVGATEVVARDFESGEKVIVPLDASLSPSANMEAYFRKQKKAERRVQHSLLEQDITKERLEKHTALERDFERICGATDADLVAQFAERSEVRQLFRRFFAVIRQENPSNKRVFRLGKRELPTRLVPKCYGAAGGLEIWVGKNDEGNDVLTMSLARSYDFFFHLEGSPGSHVVLRVQRGLEPPQEALLEASELAVHFSKQRNVRRANVHIAQCKDISKPKGGKAGLVYVHRGRTLDLRRDTRRLERILSARVDDSGSSSVPRD